MHTQHQMNVWHMHVTEWCPHYNPCVCLLQCVNNVCQRCKHTAGTILEDFCLKCLAHSVQSRNRYESNQQGRYVMRNLVRVVGPATVDSTYICKDRQIQQVCLTNGRRSIRYAHTYTPTLTHQHPHTHTNILTPTYYHRHTHNLTAFSMARYIPMYQSSIIFWLSACR